MAAAELVQIIAERAEASPDTTAYEFLDQKNVIRKLSYQELYARARRIAGVIRRQQEKPGDPVAIVYPPGLDYVVAVYACFLAGTPAVPAYPPDPGRLAASRERLTWILRDAGGPLVLAADTVAPAIAGHGAGPVITERFATGEDDRDITWPEVTAADTALIQYTSGSSAAPRGVRIRHSNLEHNMRAIAHCLRAGPGTRAVMWLPPYHDMGLIGGILTPLFAGFPVRLMSSFDFLKRPLEWLRQISEFGATASAAPNFAYDLCVRRARVGSAVDQLDLSRWTVAFNGAEPVRGHTMRAFADTFGPAGFRETSFFPCYGLAEATLLVSGGHWNGKSTEHVSNGAPLPDQTTVVIDTESGQQAPDETEGEIWVSGPSVTDGYWRSTDSAKLFAYRGDQRFLRTGDVGYLADGELVVTGRSTDVLVHLGMNYHATDIERAASGQDGLDGLRPVAAAFMVDRGPAADIVVVVEQREQAAAREKLAATARRRVLAASGLAVSTVVVGPPGTVPRTANGKVQRPLCRLRYLAGDYDDLVAYAAYNR